jgi:hypothetical protein
VPSSRPEGPSADAVWIAIAIVLGLTTLLWSWAALHTEHWQRYELIDIGVYERYGDAIVDGEIPYRDFGPEYPPLSLAVFVLPAAIVGAGAAEVEYGDAFELTMLACGLALVLVSAATLVSLGASPLRLCVALGLVGATPLLLGSVILTRFDLWPALLTGAALLGFVRGRDRVGSGLLGAAVAAKLYPLALAPVALAFVWRRKGRREAVWCAAVIAAVVALCFAPFVALAPGGVVESLSKQFERPLQVESLPAAAVVALGVDVEIDQSHGSQNIGGGIGEAAALGSTVALVAALAWVWTAAVRARGDREDLVRLSAAAVVALVAFGKVLSPQFMIWLVPLVPLVGGRRGLPAAALFAVALGLTQVWFPGRYWDYALGLDRGVAAVVLARDLVLVALFALLAWPTRASGDGEVTTRA